MLNVQMNSFGEIDPMKTRAFSTMNAPAIYAAVAACGLLLLFNIKGKLRLLSAAAGFIGLILTLSRASWLTFAAGCVYLVGVSRFARTLPADDRRCIVLRLSSRDQSDSSCERNHLASY